MDWKWVPHGRFSKIYYFEENQNLSTTPPLTNCYCHPNINRLRSKWEILSCKISLIFISLQNHVMQKHLLFRKRKKLWEYNKYVIQTLLWYIKYGLNFYGHFSTDGQYISTDARTIRLIAKGNSDLNHLLQFDSETFFCTWILDST